MVSVQKYGGCYLKDMSDLKAIAKHVASTHQSGDGLVIVVAAMHSIAKGILEMADNIDTEISSDELDSLFSSGEKQTAALMAVALGQEGLQASSVSDIKGYSLSDLDLEEGKHEINVEPIDDILSQGQIAVVAGFQGIGDFHSTDREGRYGAAATAVSIAAKLGCDCELYGNTKGIYTLDPSGVSKSSQLKVIDEISYEEAMEMILLGKSDLESRALELGKRFDVKIYVGPALSNDKNGGTYIMDRSLIVKEAAVTGISLSDDIVVYTLNGISGKGDAIAELFQLLGDLEVNIDMISQQSGESGLSAVSFSCGKNKIPDIDKAFAGNQRLRNLKIGKRDDLTLVSIIGVGMASHVGVASKVFSVLASENIRHYNITTSEISISAAIDASNRSKAMVALGEAFDL